MKAQCTLAAARHSQLAQNSTFLIPAQPGIEFFSEQTHVLLSFWIFCDFQNDVHTYEKRRWQKCGSYS